MLNRLFLHGYSTSASFVVAVVVHRGGGLW